MTTFVETDAHVVVVKTFEFDPGAGIEAQRHGANLDLGAGARPSCHDVATGQRLVEQDGFVFATFAAIRTDQGHVAGNPGDPADAARRIALGKRRQCDRGGREGQQTQPRLKKRSKNLA